MHLFRLVGLDPAPFEALFLRTDAELEALGVRRMRADATPGYPCRVSLQDAAIGDEVLLLSYPHQPAASPYRASGPIFVRRGAVPPMLAAGQVPDCVGSRLMSLRAYDAGHAIIDADVCEGSAVAHLLTRMFAEPGIAYVHLHNARRGCFSCTAVRADAA